MYGLNIDPNNAKGNPDPAELKELGVQAVRYTFYDPNGGGQVDASRAQFYKQKAQAYHEVGIQSLVILTYDTYPSRPAFEAGDGEWDNYIDRFSRRSGQIAQLLAPWRPAFQVWNEPDHPVSGAYNPAVREAVFGRMLRRTYDAIKAVDSSFRVVTGGLATGDPSWLTTVVQSQGGVLPADIVAFHPYGQRPNRDWPHPNWFFGYVGDLLDKYFRAGQGKPIWITEMGVKEEDLDDNREQVAEFLRRYYETITNHYSHKVEWMYWFCYSDGMVRPFGLTDAAGNRKPSYFAFLKTATTGALPQPEPTPSLPPQPELVTLPPAPVTEPVAVAQPQPVAPPTPPVLVTEIGSQDLTRITSQMADLQNQVAQLRNQFQQLLNQQTQLQNQVQQLQSAIGRPAPPIQNITNQLKRDPNQQFPTRSPSQIQWVIIHHTAIPPTIGAERIAEHRVDQQGWPGIGYHYFITGNGLIQQTNELTTVSRHAGPYDPVAIGVCFAGDFTNAIPTTTQIEAGAQLIAWLLPQFGLSIKAILGYKELVNTQSPGLQWDSGARWGEQLRAQIQARL